jgi:hypothetical protein
MFLVLQEAATNELELVHVSDRVNNAASVKANNLELYFLELLL